MYSYNFIDERRNESFYKAKVKLINQPEGFDAKFIPEMESFELIKRLNSPVDFIYLFVKSKDELLVELPVLSNFLKRKGTIIISYPNIESSSISDLSFEIINELAAKSYLKFSKKISLDNMWESFMFLYGKN